MESWRANSGEEKIAPAGHDLPANGQTEFGKDGDQAVEDFGDAAAHGSRIHHLDAAALQALGERAEFVDLRQALDRRVIVELQGVCFGDFHAHFASSPSTSAMRRAWMPSSVRV